MVELEVQELPAYVGSEKNIDSLLAVANQAF